MIWIKKGKKIWPLDRPTGSNKMKVVIITGIVSLSTLPMMGYETDKKPVVIPSVTRTHVTKHVTKRHEPIKQPMQPRPSIPPQNPVVESKTKQVTKSIIITHHTLLSSLTNSNTKDPKIDYGRDGLAYTGRYIVGPVRVSYRIDADFCKSNKDLGLRIKKLQIEGKEQDGKRLQDVKNKLQKLFVVSDDKNVSYNVKIMDKNKSLYEQNL